MPHDILNFITINVKYIMHLFRFFLDKDSCSWVYVKAVYSSLHIFCKRSHVAQAHLELSMQPKEAHELMALLFPFPGAGISVCTNTPGFYSSGFELRALWVLGKNSANWDASQVLFLHLLLIWQILLEHCPYKIYCDMSSYESYSLKTSIFIFSIFFVFLHFFCVCVAGTSFYD